MTTTPASILGTATTNAAPPAEGTTTPPPTGDGAGAAPPQGGKSEAQLKEELAAQKAAAANKDTGDGSSAKDGKPAEGEKKPPASDASEWTAQLPEGMVADEGLLKGFASTVKELGLKPEQAQKLVDVYAGRIQELGKQYEAEQAQLVAQTKADKEYGGEKLAESLTVAKRAIDKFGTPELRKLLAADVGNHPEIVRFFVRVGKALSSDSVAGTTSTATKPANSKEAELRALYPNSPSLFQK